MIGIIAKIIKASSVSGVFGRGQSHTKLEYSAPHNGNLING